MNSRSESRQDRLMEIAEDDLSYQCWYTSHREFAEAFQSFADRQPQEIRDILWGYAESGRLMNQRLVNLACIYMDFPESPDNR